MIEECNDYLTLGIPNNYLLGPTILVNVKPHMECYKVTCDFIVTPSFPSLEHY